jgi:hypothetical protein
MNPRGSEAKRNVLARAIAFGRSRDEAGAVDSSYFVHMFGSFVSHDSVFHLKCNASPRPRLRNGRRRRRRRGVW